ncbi:MULTISPECIES: hypothetical protein [unclassified Bartonella]|uniref:hypothetical protein n=1 Tax=unclassified Bartonella TaxID=2645622 RepID=UPI0035D1129A
MNIKYFMTTFATFASISVAQGSSVLFSQKLIQDISAIVPPIDLFSSERSRKILSEVFQIELSCTNNSECITAAQLVPVLHSGKKRDHYPKKGSGKRRRPNLFARGPMSY